MKLTYSPPAYAFSIFIAQLFILLPFHIENGAEIYFGNKIIKHKNHPLQYRMLTLIPTLVGLIIVILAAWKIPAIEKQNRNAEIDVHPEY